MYPNIIPVNRAGLVVELVLTRCCWEKGRREACKDLSEMYCGLKDPGWVLIQLTRTYLDSSMSAFSLPCPSWSSVCLIFLGEALVSDRRSLYKLVIKPRKFKYICKSKIARAL